MSIHLYDLVSGSVASEMKAHLSNRVARKPYRLDQLGEVDWTTYAPADLEDVERIQNAGLAVAQIAANVRFNYRGPADETNAPALYVTARVGSDVYLVQVFDLVEAGLATIPIGIVTFAVKIVAAAMWARS